MFSEHTGQQCVLSTYRKVIVRGTPLRFVNYPPSLLAGWLVFLCQAYRLVIRYHQ